MERSGKLDGDHKKGSSDHDLQCGKVLCAAKNTRNLTTGSREAARHLRRHYVRRGGRRSSGERA
jgi:hypothetical protein